MTEAQRKIERMYQNAMNLRDSSHHVIPFGPIEDEYQRQYLRAYLVTEDVETFKRQTREYRALVKWYCTPNSGDLTPAGRAALKGE